MKSLCIVLLLCLVGCADDPNKFIHKEEMTTAEIFDYIKHFKYQQHQYIYFTRYQQAGVVHDPDCHCFKE